MKKALMLLMTVLLSVCALDLRVESAVQASKGADYEQSLAHLTELYLSMRNLQADSYDAYIARQTAMRYDGGMLSAGMPESGGIYLDDQTDTARLYLDVPQDALYALSFDYRPEGDYLLPTVMSLMVDGQVPYEELNALQVNNVWEQNDFPLDRYGHESIAMPVRTNVQRSAYLRPVTGLYSQPLLLYLESGTHEFSFTCNDGAFTLLNLYAGSPPVIAPAPKSDASGNEWIFIEAEQMDRRNNPNIRTNAEFLSKLTPYDSTLRKQNMIDEESFKFGGGLVEYDFDAPVDGYYQIRFHYRQGVKQGLTVFRNLYIDGAIPHEGFYNVPFTYSRSYSYLNLPDAVYLTAGTHTLGIEVSLDYTRAAIRILEQIVNEMNTLTLEISKITGGNTDSFRDFNLLEYNIDAEDTLLYWADTLTETYDLLAVLNSGRGNSGELEPIMAVSKLLRLLAKEPNELPKRLEEFSYGASSARQYLTAVIESLQFSQMGLDSITLYQQEAKLPSGLGFFKSTQAVVQRFFASFGMEDYTPEYDGKTGGNLQIWVTRPRQYLEIMQRMTDSDFTLKTGIKVDLSIVPDQNKLILANAAGKTPDAAVAVASGNVYDLAIRGALHDMRRFDNYAEVASRFAPGMLIPGISDDGVYAMPETFNFYVLFYRTDILDSLGLSIPNTMEEVRDMLPQLRRMGMNFNSHVSNYVAKPFAATTPFIFQSGGQLYDEETALSRIDARAAVDGLAVLTENYNIYSMRFDIQSFYQNFRDGRTPIGVSDYHTFNLLTNAAPELAGKWGIAPYPGLTDENGEVQRWTSGAAESSVIFSNSVNKEATWQYIDWWMSTDVQTSFAYNLQTTLGNEYMWNSANLDAIRNAPWNKRHKAAIVEQLEWTYETPRIPGGYMTERELSNAVNAVVTDGKKLQSAVDDAVKNINRELRRKLEEFGYTRNGEFIRPLRIPTIDTVREWQQ